MYTTNADLKQPAEEVFCYVDGTFELRRPDICCHDEDNLASLLCDSDTFSLRNGKNLVSTQ